MEDMVGAASQSVQAGTQVVKLMGEGVSVVVKAGVQMSKAIAAFIKWLMSQTAGQKLLKMGGELKIFRVDASDMDKFRSLSKKMGVVYQVKGMEDGSYDVVMSDRQMDLINSLLNRLPSMQEIAFSGKEINNKAVVTVNEDAVRDFEKFTKRNDVFARRVSVSERPDGQREYCYYIKPEALKYVQHFLDEQANNPKTKFDIESCNAYTGSEFAEKNRHMVVVTASREDLDNITSWVASHPEMGELRGLDGHDSIVISDDALVDYLHSNPEVENRIWKENYADYLSKPRSNPYPTDDETPVINRAATTESEEQKTVRILSAHNQAMTAEELVRAKAPVVQKEEIPEKEKSGSQPSEDSEQMKAAVGAEKEFLDRMVTIGVLKKNSVVEEGSVLKDSYERMPGQENEIRAFLEHDAAIQERLINESGNEAVAVGLEPNFEAARKGLRFIELPNCENITEKRMEFHFYDRDGEAYSINMRKDDLEVAPNGKRYAWINTAYDYNIYSMKDGTMLRVSQVSESRDTKNPTETHQRPGMDLAGALTRAAAANPQPTNVAEAIEREKSELTGKEWSTAKNLSFEERADILRQEREKVFEVLPQKNDFNGALNHSQRAVKEGETSDRILCDRLNPQNYIRIHTERAVDPEGSPYSKNDFRVYHNASEVKKSDVGHEGRFTDERFEGRSGSYWLNLRSELKEKSGMSDDVLEFRSEQEFAEYYQKFLGSETRMQLEQREAAQEVRTRTQGRQEIVRPEGQEENVHRSRAVKNGTVGAFEERKYSKQEGDALEAALLGVSKKKQMGVLGNNSESGTKPTKQKAPSRKA